MNSLKTRNEMLLIIGYWCEIRRIIIVS